MSRVQQIQFSEAFESRPLVEQVAYLKRLASSSNESARVMQDERNKLAIELDVARKQLVNADSKVATNRTVMVEQLTESNRCAQEMAQRIQELERDVRALKSAAKQAEK